jgi:hypothetical protein
MRGIHRISRKPAQTLQGRLFAADPSPVPARYFIALLKRACWGKAASEFFDGQSAARGGTHGLPPARLRSADHRELFWLPASFFGSALVALILDFSDRT